MDESPRVSIIIPTKNRAGLLVETLGSIRAQTYGNWECRVIDDRSSDETARIMADVAKSESRVIFENRRSETRGANVCRNQGLAGAIGKYVIFLDSDDLLTPHCLAARVAAMEADQSLDFATFGIEVFHRTPGDVGLLWNAPRDIDDLSRFLELDAVWQTMAPIWRRAALDRLGPWDESLLSFQDWELHVRALAMGLHYRRFSDPDCFLRYPVGREAISENVSSADHLRSHLALLGKVHRVLEQNAALNEPRKRRLIGLYLWLADKFRRAGLHAEAAQTWRRCRNDGLIGPWKWAEGRLYLAGQRIPLARRATRHYLLWSWPGEMIRKGSRTVMNVPAREGIALRAARKTRAGFYEFPA